MNNHKKLISSTIKWIVLIVFISNPLFSRAFSLVDSTYYQFINAAKHNIVSGLYYYQINKKYLFSSNRHHYNLTIYIGGTNISCDSFPIYVENEVQNTIIYNKSLLYTINHKKQTVRTAPAFWADIIKQFDLTRLLLFNTQCIGIESNLLMTNTEIKYDSEDNEKIVYRVQSNYNVMDNMLQSSETLYGFSKIDSSLLTFTNYIYGLNDTQIYSANMLRKTPMPDSYIIAAIEDTLEYYRNNYTFYEESEKPPIIIDTSALSIYTLNLLNTHSPIISNKDQYLLVDYWYSACAPCLLSMPVLQRVADEFKDKVVVVGVNPVDVDTTKAKIIARGRGVNYQTIYLNAEDKSNTLHRGYPTLLIYNKHKQLIKIILGYSSRLYDDIVSLLH